MRQKKRVNLDHLAYLRLMSLAEERKMSNHIDPAYAGIIHGTGSGIQETQGEVIRSDTAQAQSEYAHARWSEFSIDAGKITIT